MYQSYNLDSQSIQESVLLFYVNSMTNINSIRTAVAKNVKRMREEMGLTQEMLSERLGYSTSHIANIESGKTGLSDELLASLCNLFHRKPSEIYNDPDLSFSSDKILSETINDSVETEFLKSAKEISEKILWQVTNTLTLDGYMEKRQERTEE